AIKPLKINQHDEPVSPLSHEAISPKYPDDGQLPGYSGQAHAGYFGLVLFQFRKMSG
ncbi:hypothetical protein IWQ55_006063, partial [Labrenzia sp. EL_208]|nr:hypothetical protein [Labrenzia sp. EL_132]MBG6232829.1 hypothetical protein [Labrenzia sp. EL_208]